MAKSSKRTSTTRYSFSNERISIALPSDWDRWDAPEGMLFSASAPGVIRVVRAMPRVLPQHLPFEAVRRGGS